MAKRTSDSPVVRVLYDMDDAGIALSMSVPKVYELINGGALETVKIGTRRFTTLEMMNACVEKLRSADTPAPNDVPNNKRKARVAA